MTTVRVSGLAIETEGDGPPVVLVHGLGGTSNSFQPLLGAMSGFRLVRPDLPGAGRSALQAGKPSVEAIVDALTAAMGHLGISRAHFVGHSFGTLVVQHLAARTPELAASLTLFGPILEPLDAARDRLRARADLARRDGMDVVADQLIEGSLSGATRADNPLAAAYLRETHMRQDAEGFARSCEALAGAEKADHRQISCPALIVTGDEDGVGPPSVARELGDCLAQAKVVVLDRCGHWTPLERPRECGRLLSEFVRGLPI
ncbi:alpha/beta fold hydrolase [Amorphus orientalis]|uniref:Pimeloyl-ACP methyl ester carboxylesterase n=1 Tax=Amorphus orientalis TaxID=649198 RepID=A0AAE3VL01_9HYPH|nr:alpha/beta hydrolase [Amorphus orientalis]MDQ0313641.1 pimeloyl-ACP methyl ester carboxylesterase [Amorphus orientalis]